MFYDKKIKYLDYLENGDKIRSAGFVKIEVADEFCNIQININGLYPTDTFVKEVWISDGNRETVLGEVSFESGRGQAQWKRLSTDRLGQERLPYNELAGLRISLGKNRELRCRWSEYVQRKAASEARDITDGAGDGEQIGDENADAGEWIGDENAGAGERIGDEDRDTGSVKEWQTGPEKNAEGQNGKEDSPGKQIVTGTLPDMEREPEEASGWHTVEPGFYETVDRARDAKASVEELSRDGIISIWEAEPVHNAVVTDREQPIRPIAGEPVQSSSLALSLEEPQCQSLVQNQETGQEWRAAVIEGGKKISGDGDSRPKDEVNNALFVKWMEPDDKQRQTPAPSASPVREAPSPSRSDMVNPGESSGQDFVAPRPPEEPVKQKNPAIPERLFDDKWKQLSSIYPHVSPFHDERDYLSIGPGDFVILQRGYHKLVNNSFLLHGYYNYEHLILTRVANRTEERYYVGVPGNFYEREKQVAVMFGFESFECKKEPAQTGDFGYYMIRVEI